MFSKKGFTLTELIIAMIILATLAAIALPQYTKSIEKSRGSEAIVNVKAMSESINRFYDRRGSYPSGTVESALSSLDVKFYLPKHFSVRGVAGSSGQAYSLSFSRTKRPAFDAALDSSNYYLEAESTRGELRKISCVSATEGYCHEIFNCMDAAVISYCTIYDQSM